ncbi:MAG TPA: zinc ribbon domain-containing protein [Solirubrobacteraceae bacterium]|nr:zinc ribbon domain-containing protein [Solirubrobacteraceae bacterium]
MSTLLADPASAGTPEQQTATAAPLAPGAGGGGPDASDFPPAHECPHCGTPLQEGQQWCLNCGACEPGSLEERPNWRPLSVLALTAAILVAGAAVAVAAAIKEHNASSPPAAKTLALTPATPPATTTPPAAVPPATTPATGGAGGTPSPAQKGSGSNLLFPPSSSTKPPKVTAPTPTPKGDGASGATGESSAGGGTKTTPAKTKTTETGSSTTTAGSEGGSGKSEQPTPILLDTNAASTYNPYNYPESGFGDPALAIDGEPSTAWTAQVQPHSFPSMAEGLLIDMRQPNKLGSVELRTPTKGLVVQLYGANGTKAPATITEPGWVLLSGSHTLKKTVAHLKLRGEGHSYRWLLVWLVQAPPSAQGTAAAPGRVALSEVALYPPSA